MGSVDHITDGSSLATVAVESVVPVAQRAGSMGIVSLAHTVDSEGTVSLAHSNLTHSSAGHETDNKDIDVKAPSAFHNYKKDSYGKTHNHDHT